METKIRFFCFLLIFILLLPYAAMSADSSSAGAERPADSWQFLAGYGVSHPGLGKTETHVETVDLIGRYEHVFPGYIGPSWLPAAYHSIYIELPVHMVVDPDVAPIVGLNILGAFTFAVAGNISPYWFFGGGPLYTDADIDGLGARVNGNYQFGVGMIYKRVKGRKLRFEYRFHHISNAGAKDPNLPLNSSKILVGWMF